VILFDARDRRTHAYFIAGRYRGVRKRLAAKRLDADAFDQALRAHEERRRCDEKKLEQMLLYAQSPACRWRFLLEHFDDPAARDDFECGTCDACRHPPEWQIAQPEAATIFPRPAESPLPRADGRRPQLQPGQKVDVPGYGEGEITRIDGDKVEVSFADGELRKFKQAFLSESSV
jgi:hypothetical protein